MAKMVMMKLHATLYSQFSPLLKMKLLHLFHPFTHASLHLSYHLKLNVIQYDSLPFHVPLHIIHSLTHFI